MGTAKTQLSCKRATSRTPNSGSNAATLTATSANANAKRLSLLTCESHWVINRFASASVAKVRAGGFWRGSDWRNWETSTALRSICRRVAAICWTCTVICALILRRSRFAAGAEA